MTERIRQACTVVANHLRRRQRRPPFTPFQDRSAPDPDGLPPDKILEKEWKERWHRNRAKARASRPQRTITAAEQNPSFHSTGKIVRLHGSLMKHESAALVQMRTEKIGLRKFLFYRKVPDVDSPMCECWEGTDDHYQSTTSTWTARILRNCASHSPSCRTPPRPP
ncbi:hypothetical protein E4U13_003442 [Claviceps humidiphila]|uniref:Uncharacterized protein n=1 Tax=Claviceps humidiphila TaxID=1294629 RepID=A0A9P7Q6W2_9HYPO|nr:hypothetical protein E4U13_003442 [Claviceps humidiphila]